MASATRKLIPPLTVALVSVLLPLMALPRVQATPPAMAALRIPQLIMLRPQAPVLPSTMAPLLTLALPNTTTDVRLVAALLTIVHMFGWMDVATRPVLVFPVNVAFPLLAMVVLRPSRLRKPWSSLVYGSPAELSRPRMIYITGPDVSQVQLTPAPVGPSALTPVPASVLVTVLVPFVLIRLKLATPALLARVHEQQVSGMVSSAWPSTLLPVAMASARWVVVLSPDVLMCAALVTVELMLVRFTVFVMSAVIVVPNRPAAPIPRPSLSLRVVRLWGRGYVAALYVRISHVLRIDCYCWEVR